MIYVDSLIRYEHAPKIRGQNRQWCHMYADSEDELHNFAVQLGLKREWYQSHTVLPHYDIIDSKRTVAIRLGAQEVDRSFVVARIKIRRSKCGICVCHKWGKLTCNSCKCLIN